MLAVAKRSRSHASSCSACQPYHLAGASALVLLPSEVRTCSAIARDSQAPSSSRRPAVERWLVSFLLN
jgi:hypothetical protein